MPGDRQGSETEEMTTPQSQSQHALTQRMHYGWIVLAMGTLVVFGALGLARFGYAMVLPAMQTACSWTTRRPAAWPRPTCSATCVLSVVGGALASRFGPRRVIAAGLAWRPSACC